MDLVWDQVADRGVDRAVAGDLVEAVEARRDDEDRVVAGAAASALVAGVSRALILERDVFGGEPGPQAVEEPLLAGHRRNDIPSRVSGPWVDSGSHSRIRWGMRMYGHLPMLVAVAVLAGCSTRRPVLYPNQALQQAGPEGADRAIADCMQLADGYVKGDGGRTGKVARDAAVGGGVGAASGAVGGAIWGNPGQGAAAGAAAGVTAGLLTNLFNGSGGPSATYQNYVNTCLAERGYRVIGWD